MPRLSPRVRILFAILLLGVCSQIVQAVLIRESLVVFYGNEVSLGAFFGSWLFWIALGSWMVVRWRDRPVVRQAQRSLARIMLLLPFLLVAQVIAVRTVRALFDIPSIELVPLGDLFLSLSLITLPSSLALGFAFPLACKSLVDLAGAPLANFRFCSMISSYRMHHAILGHLEHRVTRWVEATTHPNRVFYGSGSVI